MNAANLFGVTMHFLAIIGGWMGACQLVMWIGRKW
jgi:hypothetical protein